MDYLYYFDMKVACTFFGAKESALRLFVSIIAVYLIAHFHRLYFRNRKPNVQHLFFGTIGFLLGYYNIGLDIYHSMIAVVFTHRVFYIYGPTKTTVKICSIFHMSHLMLGYWFTENEVYDIHWTLPHCVLVLRLIGLSFDLWDGSKPEESLSETNKKTALSVIPSFLEMWAFVYFPGCFLVGPQFSIKRYTSFISGTLEHSEDINAITVGNDRAMIGLTYLGLHHIGSMFYPASYLLSTEFKESSVLYKHGILAIWGKIAIAKYIACWLLIEGACICTGMPSNGKSEEDEEIQWDGCRNIDIYICENYRKFGDLIKGFNITTNNWVSQYVYKRLQFLGSKHASQILSLIFLAVWHGFYSGYYMTFFLEFAITYMEYECGNIIHKNESFLKIKEKWFDNSLILTILIRIYLSVFMGYCLVPFVLLTFEKWWQVYESLYFSGFVIYFPWVYLYKPIVKYLFKPTFKSS